MDYQLPELKSLVVSHMIGAMSTINVIHFAFLAQRASSDTLFQVSLLLSID